MDIERAFSSGALRVALAVASVAAAGTVSAQPSELTFGPGGSTEQAGRGVAPVRLCPGGGSIAAGSTGDTAIGMSRIYVVRTASTGRPLWEHTYDLAPGTFGETGESIVELSDGSGFVVAGSSRSSATQRDAFLMKIDCDGQVRWSYAYSNSTADEVALDVTEARTGTVASSTAPGDLIVAGLAGAPVPGNMLNGLLFRTDAAGRLIWSQRYELPGVGVRLAFNAAIEARPTAVDAAGDVVAAGYLTSPTAGERGYALRVSGADGSLSSPLHCGGSFGAYGRVRFEAVAERYGSGAPLVFLGSAIAHNSRESQAVVVSTLVLPCRGVAARVIGGPVGQTLGLDVQHVASPLPVVPTGALAITGSTTRPGKPGTDAFLLTLDPTTLAPFSGKGRLFGSRSLGFEAGHSLAVLHDGFLIAGRTTGLGGAYDPGDLYLVKADAFGRTACGEGWEPAHSPFPASAVPARPTAFRYHLQQPVRAVAIGVVTSPTIACP
jgi:hypothetical protein